MARNGYLAEDGIRLVTVEDNDQLIATAAASFTAMRAAAARDGVSLSIVEPAGAYRRAWVQNDMVDNPSRYNLNPASVIGFSRYGQSHGWGNRIDVNSAAVPWMLKHAAKFGWTREYGAKDPNHFKHDGRTATGGGGGGGIREDNDMFIHKVGTRFYVTTATACREVSSAEAAALSAGGGRTVEVTAAQLDQIAAVTRGNLDRFAADVAAAVVKVLPKTPAAALPADFYSKVGQAARDAIVKNA